MQAKISVRSSGNSQRAIMANMTGTVFVVFQDGAINGLNVAQMIRSLTASTLSGWQENKEQATDLSQLSASFKIDKGQAQTTDLNLVGPLVKMTGVGTIDLGTKQIGFRVEPKLVMTTEGQGRASEPVGLGIPVIIDGPWGAPRIYPEMQGILDNPDGAYAKLKEMGKGLFGQDGAGLGGCGIGACSAAAGGRRPTSAVPPDRARPAASTKQSARRPARRDHRQSAAAGPGRVGPRRHRPEPGTGQGGARPGGQRSIPSRASPAEAPQPRPRRPRPPRPRRRAASGAAERYRPPSRTASR